MDSLAKMYWLETFHLSHDHNLALTGELWPTFHCTRKIHSALHSTLYEEIYHDKLALHREHNDHLSSAHSQWINWDACTMAMKRLKIVH